MNDLTDFHTHILPGVDDGSHSEQMSLDMLRRQGEAGVRRVVLTPHFYPWRDTPERFLEERALAMERLQSAAEPGMPELYLGAEVAYFRGMSDSDALRDLCMGDTKYILVELPMEQWNAQVYEELEQIAVKQGLTPIVAHVDRYLTPLTARRTVEKLLALPLLLQANGASFLRRGSASMMLQLVKTGAVRLLGSDCHDLTERAPNLGQAADVIGRKLGPAALERMENFGKMLLPAKKL